MTTTPIEQMVLDRANAASASLGHGEFRTEELTKLPSLVSFLHYAKQVEDVATRIENYLQTHDLSFEKRMTTHITKMLVEIQAPKPVNPLLLEARELYAKFWEGHNNLTAADYYRRGGGDGATVIPRIMDGLRRGIELGEAKI